jgi:hypothetical protein
LFSDAVTKRLTPLSLPNRLIEVTPPPSFRRLRQRNCRRYPPQAPEQSAGTADMQAAQILSTHGEKELKQYDILKIYEVPAGFSFK